MFLDPLPPERSEPLVILDTRPMTHADLQVIENPPPGRPGASPLKRVTERHHALARLLAAGTAPGQAAIITGYGAATVSILQADPSFHELVVFYRGEAEAEYLTMQAQLAGLGADAIAELRRRVEENPQEIGMSSLLEVVKMAADRTGNGPSSSSKQEFNVTVDLASRMKEARERGRLAIEATARDITPGATE